MKKPDLLSGFEFNGHVDVEWYDVLEVNEIPDLNWQHVYIIGSLDGKVPVVISRNHEGKYNLPGGRTEQKETVEETMRREVEEELNMEVIAWKPLGYQKCTRAGSDDIAYQFRAYAKLRKIGDFTNDPGGSVIGHELVNLDELNNYINYGNVGERLISITRQYFT